MPETFSPITWRNDQAPAINETNLNRLEVGVEAIDDRVDQLEKGIVAPITVPYATSVTLNATQGGLFRCVASGDLTLDDIVGGVDGQTAVFEVQASGAERTLQFTGSTAGVVIGAGQWWVGTFRYVAGGASVWLLDDGSGGASGGLSNNLNILAPQNIPWATTITPNAALGALFRITAVDDFTLTNPVNGTDGQSVFVEVLASGAQRVVTLAGGQAGPIAIANGARWTVQLRYNQDATTWVLQSRSDVTTGGGGGGVASVNGFTGTVLLDADDLPDGSGKVQMTTAERTKLTGVATGATANASDSALRDRATHTGLQAISTVTGLQAALDAKTNTTVAVNPQSGNYTFVLADVNRAVHSTASAGVAHTVPPNSSVAFPVGTVILDAQLGTGQITITPGSGVTVRTASSSTSRAQYSELSLRKIGTDEWLLAGDLT